MINSIPQYKNINYLSSVQSKKALNINYVKNCAADIQDSFIKSSEKKDNLNIYALSAPIISFGAGLKEEDVLNKMNAQICDITKEDIEDVLSSFDEKNRPLSSKILYQASQFGNINSLNSIYDTIMLKKMKGYHPSCLSEGSRPRNGILENLSYLYRKNAFNYDPAYFQSATDILMEDKGAFVLDDNLLSVLESNKHLREHIAEHDFQLFYPTGWNKGITVFNLTSKDEIAQKLDVLLSQVKKITANGRMNEEQAITFALNYDVYKRLMAIDLEDKLVPVSNINQKNVTSPTAEDIANQFKSNKADLEKFKRVLPKKRELRKAALEILDNDARIVSMRKMGFMAKEMHSNIIKLAQENNIAENQIYYWIPRLGKSFGMVALQYQQINNIPEDKIIASARNIYPDSDKKMLVLLDDFVGSGDSMRHLYYQLTNFKGQIVLAPYYTTETGFNALSEACKDNEKTHILPGEILESYFDTEAYKNKKIKTFHKQLIGEGGWKNTASNIVFPYMAPDNNTAFFSAQVADLYTLNGAGVKDYETGVY